jgi:hypothetical protein
MDVLTVFIIIGCMVTFGFAVAWVAYHKSLKEGEQKRKDAKAAGVKKTEKKEHE